MRHAVSSKRRLPQHEPVLATVLGRVQSLVRSDQRCCQGIATVYPDQADADGHRMIGMVLAHPAAQSADLLDSALLVQAVEQYRELLTAQPGKLVTGHARLDMRGHAFEHFHRLHHGRNGHSPV